MARPKIPNIRKKTLEHKSRIEMYGKLIQEIYDKATKEACRLAILADHNPEEMFSFADYPMTKEAFEKLMEQFRVSLEGTIMSGISNEWKESNMVQDMVANKVLSAYVGKDRNGDEFKRYYQTNPDALKSFTRRKIAGMNLSDRVWNLSEQFKPELEMAISSAIAPGISAQNLQMEIKKYLNEPDLMFRRFRYKDEKSGKIKLKWKRRIRDDEGNIKWIDCDKNSYRSNWSGPGVYKSSYKNAMRLARTEINMAYRTAEQERWKQFDFVVGYEVHTTQNGTHDFGVKSEEDYKYRPARLQDLGKIHKPDICDQLEGKYPKDFVFTGWHPQCYKEDTKVLTDKGWKFFYDVDYEDLIFSFNPKTKQTEWIEIIDQQEYDYNGEMIHFFNDNLDCIVTPNHRMPFIHSETGQISFLPAKEYNYTNGGFIQGEKRFYKESILYSGKVYDLTLAKNHIMYVSLNGKCFWGSNCLCYAVPILKTEEEFWNYDEENPQESVNEVDDVPESFKNWVNDNSQRIADWNGKLPYFLADNKEYLEEAFFKK